ncbi:MAG: flippase [Nitrospirota bacterium]
MKTSDSNNKKLNVAKNFFSFLSSRILDIATSLITTAVVARYLGVTKFGDYVFAMAVVLFIVPLTFFGLERITIREIARQKDKADSILGAALLARWVLVAIAGVIIAISIYVIKVDWYIALVIAVAAVSELINSSSTVFISVFRAYEKMEYETLITLLSKISSLICVLIVVYLNLGMIAIVGAFAFSNILKLVISMYMAEKKFVKPKFTKDLQMVKFMIKESYLLGVGIFFMMALPRISIFFLKNSGNIEGVAYFQAAFNIVQPLVMIPLSFGMAIFPIISRSVSETKDNINRFSHNISESLFLLALPIAAIIFLFSDDIIRILFGKKFLPAANVLRILSFAMAVEFMFSIYEFLLTAMGLIKAVSIGRAIAFFLNLAICMLIIPSYGYKGAAWAMVLSNGFLTAFFIIAINNAGINLFKAKMIPFIIKVISAVCIASLYIFYLKGTSILKNILVGITGLLLYIVLMFFFKGLPKMIKKNGMKAGQKEVKWEN